MLVKTVQVTIIKNQKSHLSKVVPTYEANLLKAVFGEENVIIEDRVKTEPREVESIEAEQDRLTEAYVQKNIEQLHGVNYAESLAKAIKAAKPTTVADRSSED